MNERPGDNPGGLDIDLARRIDAICRRFEADRRAGKSGAIGDYLAEVAEEGRLALRIELEALERELRGADETVAPPQGGSVAEAPTIAPAGPATAPIPGLARPSVHEEATVAPRDQATVDLGSAGPVRADAPSTNHIRYFGDYEIVRELARGGMGVVFRRGRSASIGQWRSR